jgi:pyocin large subunit-like protein
MIPREWLDPSYSLSLSDFKVAVALFSHGGRDHGCYPAVPTIAKIAGVSVRTTQRCIKRLVDLKLIQIEHRRGTTTRYVIVAFDTRGVPPKVTPGGDIQGVTQVDHLREYLKDKAPKNGNEEPTEIGAQRLAELRRFFNGGLKRLA